MQTWRWLETGEADGAWNMAVDEAVLDRYGAGAVPPTIRVYRWRPACVSLGYFQSVRGIALGNLRNAGVEIVRRLTGGRAILHQDEVTYSVVVDETRLGTHGVLATFRRISEALIAGLKRLGIESELKAALPAPQRGEAANCFAAAARCDLMSGGRKIVGSAQLRRAGTVLQHGSLPLTFDFDTAADLMPGHEDLPERVIDIRTAAARPALSAECLGQALRAGFIEALQVELKDGALTREECELARTLAATRYSTLDWTHRR